MTATDRTHQRVCKHRHPGARLSGGGALGGLDVYQHSRFLRQTVKDNVMKMRMAGDSAEQHDV